MIFCNSVGFHILSSLIKILAMTVPISGKILVDVAFPILLIRKHTYKQSFSDFLLISLQ